MTYYAKSRLKNGTQPTVKEHLEQVAKLAETYGSAFDCQRETKLIGQLHDVGKYSTAFQQVLMHQQQNVDHAFSSAALLWHDVDEDTKRRKKEAHTKEKRDKLDRAQSSFDPLIAAINGHHAGLIKAGMLTGKMEESWNNTEPVEANDKRWSALSGEKEYLTAWNAFKEDHPDFVRPRLKIRSWGVSDPQAIYIHKMLFTRFLFSCLVDADYTASATEEDETYIERTEAKPLDPQASLEKLEQFRAALAKGSTANQGVNQVRNALFEQCGRMGDQPAGLFTLTAPTGAGKTLALLHFALRHCIANGQERIIIVLPYLTLTEQNADVYREIVPELLEDHSQSRLDEAARVFAQRWSVPIIVTTSVKFFESLFADRPTDCRKLHRIANSVVIFDEAQSLPIGITKATLEAVNALCRRYKTSVVFSTATQPSFDQIEGVNWQPKEIVPDPAALFGQMKRTEVTWRLEARTQWEELAEEMSAQNSTCAIVNLRKHARKLYEALRERCGGEDCFYLTTDLCPAHRRRIVAEINERQKHNKPCRLVATQCIEAGVDLDFDHLYRALAPLESILQAAGRCNRNGRLERGEVVVFVPDEERLYPGGWYERSANIVEEEIAPKNLDIHDPETVRLYYHLLYQMAAEEQNRELSNALEAEDYAKTAKNYHLIDNDGVRVIVPDAGSMEAYSRIAAECRSTGLTPQLMKDAASLTVSTYNREALEHYAEPIPFHQRYRDKHEEGSSGFYLLFPQCEKYYNEETGLQFPQAQETEPLFC